jgi:hypothetical protein
MTNYASALIDLLKSKSTMQQRCSPKGPATGLMSLQKVQNRLFCLDEEFTTYCFLQSSVFRPLSSVGCKLLFAPDSDKEGQ